MGRGGKAGFKSGTRKRARSVDKFSDDSDEDYIVGEDEEVDESEEEEYASSFDDDEPEESLAEFEEEDEDEEEEYTVKKAKKVGRPKKVYPGRKQNGVVKTKRKKRGSYGEEDGYIDYDDFYDLDEYVGIEKKVFTKPRKKNRVSYREQDDENYDDSDDDDDDEEFRPEEIHDDVEDEDAMVDTKKNRKLGWPPLQKKSVSKGKRGKRNPKILKKTVKKKRRENLRSSSSNDGELKDNKIRVEQHKKKITGRGVRRNVISDSDSDFVNSASSDFEYTISEEEREQIREANEICRSLTVSLRSSMPIKESSEVQEPFYPQRKRLVRKGKEKEEDLKIETGKQVCGICLSEEGKRTVRGTLNCCSHYFCFACIMEWSKVESRCPLCKQRFITISKPARSDSDFDLRTVVIPVPERDQVYQPSEEEVRGYMDPYESVICTECHLGGDDALMLLCDLCDSPAHTYCVGLGHEVPEGNWYCEGCRPTAIDSLNPQGLNPTPDHRTSNNLSGVSSPINNVRETFDLNEAYVPDTPVTQATGQPSPRLFGADFQASSSVPGSGPATLFERRRIQRQIHQIFSNRRQQDSSTNGTRPTFSGNSLFGSQIGRGRELAPQYAVAQEGGVLPNYVPFQGRFQGNGSYMLHGNDAFLARPTNLRAPVIPHQASSSTATSFGNLLQNDFVGMSTRNSLGLGIHPMQNIGSNVGSDASLSPQCREVSPFNIGKEQVQSMVKSHLKSLPQEWELGYTTFKDVARSSTHTILAACGLEHRSNEVYPVQARLICTHVKNEAGEQTSMTKRHCVTCFGVFVRDVVREIINFRVTQSSKD